MSLTAWAAVLGPLGGIVVGWWLNRWTTSWQWRRQALLAAYVDVLSKADAFGLAVGGVYGQRGSKTLPDLEAEIRETQRQLAEVDRATGPLRLLGDRETATRALALYVECDRMFRMAVSEPVAKWNDYYPASKAMSAAYEKLIEYGRRELALTHRVMVWLRPEPDFHAEADAAFARLNREWGMKWRRPDDPRAD